MQRLLIIFSFIFLLAAAPDRAREANKAYERGDYPAAEQAYRQAIRDNPDDSRLHFNLGNALAQQGKTDEAMQAYERFQSMATTPEERAMADYNMGNLLAAQEQWQEAMEQYRQSLRQNPNDSDAANNYEYAKRQLQQHPPPQDQQPDDQQQQPGDDGGQGQPQQGQPDDSEEGDQEGGAQPEQQQGDEQSGDESGQDQQPGDESEMDPHLAEPQPGEMSQQEAEQLLNALRGREKDLIRDFLKGLADPVQPEEKDW